MSIRNLLHNQKTSRINYLRGLCFLPFLIILTTCTTLSPVSIQPFAFTFVDDIEPYWLPYADSNYNDAAVYFHGKIASPRLEFYALKIDLFAPNIGIVVKADSLSMKVSSFVRDNNLIAGINTVPFDIIPAAEGQPIQNLGVVISDGVMLSPPNRHFDALVFYIDENSAFGEVQNVKAAVISQASINRSRESTENIKDAVGGFHQILINGKPARRTLSSDSRHPRSAAGVSQDGRYLYLLVIDGRRAASAGGTEEETAVILKALGSHNGINFDGGGSSTLAMRFPNGIVKAVNTPVHGMIPGQERAVAGCLGITLR